jgi:hypothetical protein
MSTYKVIVDSKDFKGEGEKTEHIYKNVKVVLNKKAFDFIDLITGDCIASHNRRQVLSVQEVSD